MRKVLDALTAIGNTNKNRDWTAAHSRNAACTESGRWWSPNLAGPATLFNYSRSINALETCRGILDQLSSDAYLEYVKNFYDLGILTWGTSWEYHDINTVLLAASRAIQPRRYLEIGVRRGRSAAMVLTQQPDCEFVGFDLWMPGYAGMENPGPNFVDMELARLGHLGIRRLVSGDSRVTVPKYFFDNPDAYFDLITVDGDHTIEGARTDINNVLARLSIGGVLVFDDTSNSSHPGLKRVWSESIDKSGRFVRAEFDEVGFGVGIAVRRY